MVSTRHHPEEFPEPDLTPTRASPSSTSTPTKSTPSRVRKTARTSSSPRAWAHTPSNLTILWLFFSLPLVAWDTGYVMLRPHSMPGGWAHRPLWAPYELYGSVDYIYGWKAFEGNNGFTAAQGTLNIVETIMYIYYLYVVFAFGRQSKAKGRGAPKPSKIGFLGEQRYVEGREGAFALLAAFSAAVMSCSKTLLYFLNEYWSGFDNVGHNSVSRLIFLWIIPNGAWVVLPMYMTYVMGSEIVQGLTVAAEGVTSDETALVKRE